jgi:hypothetical protein
MNPMLQNFLSVSLPIMLTFVGTIWVATWTQNKRLDDIVRRLDAIEARLLGIETKLGDHGQKIAVLEERTSPLAKRG